MVAAWCQCQNSICRWRMVIIDSWVMSRNSTLGSWVICMTFLYKSCHSPFGRGYTYGSSVGTRLAPDCAIGRVLVGLSQAFAKVVACIRTWRSNALRSCPMRWELPCLEEISVDVVKAICSNRCESCPISSSFGVLVVSLEDLLFFQWIKVMDHW
jgi:hypothetical protein